MHSHSLLQSRTCLEQVDELIYSLQCPSNPNPDPNVMDINIADDANTESVISAHYRVDRLSGWLAFEHIESKDTLIRRNLMILKLYHDACKSSAHICVSLVDKLNDDC